MHFYLIRSAASKPDSQGTQKYSLACESDAEVFLFLWADQEPKLTHLQLLFHEQVLEWRTGQGFHISQTNRKRMTPSQIGWQKGSRTFSEVDEPNALEVGVNLLKAAQLPSPFDHLLNKQLGF